MWEKIRKAIAWLAAVAAMLAEFVKNLKGDDKA